MLSGQQAAVTGGSKPPAMPDRASKPSSSGSSLYDSSSGLRELLVPGMVMAKFLSVAQVSLKLTSAREATRLDKPIACNLFFEEFETFSKFHAKSCC